MPSRTVLVILTIALCATLALGSDFRTSGKSAGYLEGPASTLDVAVQIVSPRDSQEPGLVPAQVRLTNMGDAAALVPRLDVTIKPSNYADYRENISVGVGESSVVTLLPWVCPAFAIETCTAYITYPADSNHSNDTDVVIVHTGPFSEDVAVEIVSPESCEAPGLVPVQVKLTNIGDVFALVPRLDVTIRPSGYYDYLEIIEIGVGANQVVTLSPWVYSDIVIVNRLAGLSEGARTDMDKSPGRLSGSIARMTYCVSHAEPLNVTLFDIKGRAVIASRLDAAQGGQSSLDLRGLRSGVYLVRLDDGRRSVVQKIVVQR
jgi:hypothetical protein